MDKNIFWKVKTYEEINRGRDEDGEQIIETIHYEFLVKANRFYKVVEFVEIGNFSNHNIISIEATKI